MSSLKIGYFADGPWSHGALKLILSDVHLDVKFIVLRYQNPDPILKKLAQKNKIDVKVHKDINSKSFFNWVYKYNCDIFVSMSFNQIFRENLYTLPKYKTINCHAGLLPFYRGRNVLNWVLINGDSHFGITVHYIDSGIDTGDIILQKKYKISEKDTYETLLNKSYEECPKLIYKAILNIQNRTIKTFKQTDIHPVGFYCSRRVKGDERLNWNQCSKSIFNFVRAISKPGPQARSFHNEEEILINKIRLIKFSKNYIGIPGSVIMVKPRSFFVKTLDSFVEVLEWNNYKPKVGHRLL